ncbi:MAG: hypothetical protein AB1608_01605 [Thermoproteota archaeon]
MNENLFCTDCGMELAGNDQELIEWHKDLSHKLCPRELVRVEGEETKNQATTQGQKLYEFLQDRIKRIVISQNDSSRVYALVEINGHNETIELDTKRAVSWLKSSFYKEKTNCILIKVMKMP